MQRAGSYPATRTVLIINEAKHKVYLSVTGKQEDKKIFFDQYVRLGFSQCSCSVKATPLKIRFWACKTEWKFAFCDSI